MTEDKGREIKRDLIMDEQMREFSPLKKSFDALEKVKSSKVVESMKDKLAIEAIESKLREAHLHGGYSMQDGYFSENEKFTEDAKDLLQTLTSLGYVKMVEQKLPKDNDGYQRKYLYDINKLLSVDSEGCAYRRVQIKNIGGK